MMAVTYHDLRDKHVLITGGAGGIGAGVSEAFVGQGARVSILDFDVAAGERLVGELNGAGPGAAAFYAVDLTDFERLVPLLREIEKTAGPVDVLVNNAAKDPRYDITQMTYENWEALFKLNVGHYFITCRETIAGMKRRGGGSIIMVTSCNFWIGSADLTCYTATKAAIVGMVRSLAREVGKSMIRVNAIAPGWVMTERQLRERITEEQKLKLREVDQILPIELGPEDMAGMFLFLASNQSRAITRQVLAVDAGYAMA
jgi:NAD(P)-dependent dehydrogenase (short-subunit alcohol dehydrogenase family)